MFLRRLFFAILLTVAASGPAAAADFSATDKKEIGHVVREYLLQNPEVLVEVMSALEAKRTAQTQARQAEALKVLNTAASAMTPVVGPAKGDVTIIEFFDYQCSYCKKAFPHVRQAMTDDGNVRVHMKEFPILGPESEIGSRAALAVWKLAPKKYMAYHSALMDVRGRLTENKVMVTATEMGLKEADVRKMMADPAVTAELTATADLARQLNITGTPAFIIGGQVYPGYMQPAELKKAITLARKK